MKVISVVGPLPHMGALPHPPLHTKMPHCIISLFKTKVGEYMPKHYDEGRLKQNLSLGFTGDVLSELCCFCCGCVPNNLSYMFQGYFTGTGAISFPVLQIWKITQQNMCIFWCTLHSAKYGNAVINMIKLDIDQILNWQKTPHISPSKVSYRVSIESILENTCLIIMAPHCIVS